MEVALTKWIANREGAAIVVTFSTVALNPDLAQQVFADLWAKELNEAAKIAAISNARIEHKAGTGKLKGAVFIVYFDWMIFNCSITSEPRSGWDTIDPTCQIWADLLITHWATWAPKLEPDGGALLRIDNGPYFKLDLAAQKVKDIQLVFVKIYESKIHFTLICNVHIMYMCCLPDSLNEVGKLLGEMKLVTTSVANQLMAHYKKVDLANAAIVSHNDVDYVFISKEWAFPMRETSLGTPAKALEAEMKVVAGASDVLRFRYLHVRIFGSNLGDLEEIDELKALLATPPFEFLSGFETSSVQLNLPTKYLRAYAELLQILDACVAANKAAGRI